MCNDGTHLYTVYIVPCLPFSLNGSNMRLYRFTHFCQFEVSACLLLRSSFLAPPYIRANSLYVDKGPCVTHHIRNVVVPVWIGLGSGSYVIILLYHLSTQLNLICYHPTSKFKDFLSLFV